MAEAEIVIVVGMTLLGWFLLVRAVYNYRAVKTFPPLYVALAWGMLSEGQRIYWYRRLQYPEEQDFALYSHILTHVRRSDRQVAYLLQDLRPTEEQLLAAQRQVHRNPHLGFGSGIIAFDIAIGWSIGVLREWRASGT